MGLSRVYTLSGTFGVCSAVKPYKFMKGRKTMPNIKSAKKRVKVISAKTLQNKMAKSQFKTAVKKYLAAVESGNKAEAEALYPATIKVVDRAVAKGLLHKNNAANKKSRFTRLLNKMA